ncbi:hypothetical protein Lal_00002753 [Lupinus albus]|nr:hypothetical protein Lal_00002753 [Lupinus albus]
MRDFQEQGALGLILELEKREILRLEAVSVELEKLPRTKPNTHREESRRQDQIYEVLFVSNNNTKKKFSGAALKPTGNNFKNQNRNKNNA